jgi:hypothetical protein
LENVGIFNGHLEYFTDMRYTYIFYGHYLFLW